MVPNICDSTNVIGQIIYQFMALELIAMRDSSQSNYLFTRLSQGKPQILRCETQEKAMYRRCQPLSEPLV